MNATRFGFLVVTCGVGLAACGEAGHWAHPDFTQEFYQRDRYECYREAAMVPRVAQPSAPAPSGDAFSDGFNEGIYLGGLAGAAEAEARADALYAMCMENRGYRWQED